MTDYKCPYCGVDLRNDRGISILYDGFTLSTFKDGIFYMDPDPVWITCNKCDQDIKDFALKQGYKFG